MWWPAKPSAKARSSDVKTLRQAVGAAGLWYDTCVVNRGVVLVDARAWTAQHTTEEIEQWMVWHADAVRAAGGNKGGLYHEGSSVSQAPFLTAIAHRFTDLGPAWNVRGLGRIFMQDNDKGTGEVRRFRRSGPYFIPSRFIVGWNGTRNAEVLPVSTNKKHRLRTNSLYPFYAAHAPGAKLLHFSGAHKPWKPVPDLRGRTDGKRDTAQLCETSVCPLVPVRNESEFAAALAAGRVPACDDVWGRFCGVRGCATGREAQTWAWLLRAAANANASTVPSGKRHGGGTANDTSDAAVDALWMHYCASRDCLPADSCKCHQQGRGKRICEAAVKRLFREVPRAFEQLARTDWKKTWSRSSLLSKGQFQCSGWSAATAGKPYSKAARLVNRLRLKK